jgi:hypothetical protein
MELEMTSAKAFGFVVAFAAGALALAPRGASAQSQDCGSGCRGCSIGGYEGYDWSPNGLYNMTCYQWIPYCVACVIERTNDGEDAEALLGSVRSASEADLRGILLRSQGRLLLNPSRNLVVLRGTKCNPKALASVVYVTPARTALLRGLGVPLLETYLRDQGSGQ